MGSQIRVYGLRTCDTCRKALKMLKDSGKAAVLVDVRAEGVPAEAMARAQDKFGESLLNKRSATWRGLSEDARGGAVPALLAAHPALMKRPLIAAGGQLWLGWDKAVQAELVG